MGEQGGSQLATMESLNGPVLVTGANGFVGTWLLKTLVAAGIPT
jgi:nucleoside-diphosphate-sugar epimerase